MHRRRYLALVGGSTLGVAGCLLDDPGDAVGEETPASDSNGGATSTPSATRDISPDASPTPSPTRSSSGSSSRSPTTTAAETSTPPPDVDVVLEDATLTSADLKDYSGTVADLRVTNQGDAPTQSVAVSVDWSGDGEHLGTSGQSIPTIAAGETWVPRVDPWPEADNVGRINGYEPSVGPTEPTSSLGPEGVRLVDSFLGTGRSELGARVDIRNDRDSWLSHLVVVAKLYDERGEVIGHAWTAEENVPPGAEKRFRLEPTTAGRDDAVESMTIVLSDEPLAD